MSTDRFHPAVAAWFAKTFAAPTPAQAEAWPAIQATRDVLIAAPTGSGKTLAAFLAAIDTLVREADQAAGALPDETRVIYVSPLKALSNDVQKNLLVPLAGIDAELVAEGRRAADIRAWVRTGDTPARERASMGRRPPHILVTTPESLYILLGSASGRAMLSTARSVIVDEIHALVGNKRGEHLALTLERLDALAGRRMTRIGLSATQRPLDEVARFLVGAGRLRNGDADCTVIDSGHVRARDLALEVPPTPLGAVMSGEQWDQVYDRIAQLVREHRSTLVFVNTRRHAERAARQLSQRLGEVHVAAHHGSLARERRLDAEQRLKRGELKALVATASLELGIDIGDVDLVCQLGSTRSINAFLQRVGRSGHGVGGLPKGRLFPSTRDELVECTALLDAVRRGELDQLSIPRNALDVLAQQIVAEVSCVEWGVEELYHLFRRAYPYRDLERADFDAVLRTLSEGYSTRRGRRAALVFHDAVHGRLRGRKGAKITAVTSGGTIPDVADYQVVLEPEGLTIGSVNEDFAVESIAGDVFQLGNASYRILRVERSTVRVEDARGQPPSIPFWLGEAPGRTDELSRAVSRLRQEIERRLEARSGVRAAVDWLVETVGLDQSAAEQLVAYLAAARAALGTLPTHDTIVLERFFDEAGGMQLVVHSPYGSRINRAWGLALRKRFCRQFNFELQAAATEDCIVLSLTTAHSFELAEVARYLHPNTARDILVQALLAAPMFTTRWRWTAGVALALPRFRGGKKVPPQIARMNAEDLLASVFPEQVGCAENLPGDIPVPDHPLVRQTLRDCLEEAMDVAGFESLLRGLAAGTIGVVARDLVEPSPLAQEVLTARPYAYLDDAPLEERRTQAVMSRRWLDPEDAAELGRLDPAAIARVRGEAWPEPTSSDEMHDALMWVGFLTAEEVAVGPGWGDGVRALVADGRVVAAVPQDAEEPNAAIRWIAVERVPLWRALHPDSLRGTVVPAPHERAWNPEDACRELVRGRLQALGPTTAAELAASMQVSLDAVEAALVALETEGFVLRGQFDTSPDRAPAVTQWCERRLLARIHRYTVKRLRAEIEPVQARDFMRYLFEWQGVARAARRQGPDAVPAVLNQLAGFDVPAGAWESEVLPSRVADYEPEWLDEHCLAGRYLWTRLAPRAVAAERTAAPVRSTPIVLLPRRDARLWSSLVAPADMAGLTANARAVAEFIQGHGAAFFDEIVEGAHLLPTQTEAALSELVALGLVNADSFAGLRVLLLPVDRRRRSGGSRRPRARVALFGMEDAGRWSLVHRGVRRAAEKEGAPPPATEVAVEHVARVLLQRWGVVFWKVYQRESAWLPPWRELLMVYRRLEARGEIRGGRFVAGFAGEQYALPAAIGALREARRRSGDADEWISISAADPLNVVGLLTPGARVPALARNRVLFHDGMPVAALSGGEVCYYEQYDEATQWVVRNRLLRRPALRKTTALEGEVMKPARHAKGDRHG